ncbi:SEFIR domain-containing protein [Chryseobacterium sp. 22458]|uniref:SEFIR domain-containing protein n=1 Tax=Chryseobacterium sp. 22458 TaxID=3453921 RepID=UPI003F8442ED
MSNRKKVFISYSWDNEEHQNWVLKLANDLISKYGVDVILDQFDLNAGKELTYFMENAISEADKVLVILTPNYKQRAEKREKGVGYETSIISQDILSSSLSKIKFIPILRIGTQVTSAPSHLVSKLYHNMVDDTKYYSKLLELAKLIYDKNLIEKPDLGAIPNFDDIKIIDPLLDIINEFTSESSLNNKLDRIVDSYQGANILAKEKDLIISVVQQKGEFYTENTQLEIKTHYDNRESIKINCMGYSAIINFNGIATNTAKYAILLVRYFRGYISFSNSPMYFPGEEPKQISSIEYKFDIDKSENVIWKSKSENFTSEKLINEVYATIITDLKNAKSKNFR